VNGNYVRTPIKTAFLVIKSRNLSTTNQLKGLKTQRPSWPIASRLWKRRIDLASTITYLMVSYTPWINFLFGIGIRS